MKKQSNHKTPYRSYTLSRVITPQKETNCVPLSS
ncbi:hypothetical protein NC651_003640 [Populus alba x Populus x berolinensis]|nr:hypothetical protein NC651_003640 [Populus alba x Populus x berolinensis]